MGVVAVVGLSVLAGFVGGRWASQLIAAHLAELGSRPRREPLFVTAATVALLAAFSVRFGLDLSVVAFWVLGVALVALVWIDAIDFRLPREISYPAFTASSVVLVVSSLISGERDPFVEATIGAGAATALLWVVHVVSRGDLGDGDVRMAPLLGLHLGWIDLWLVPIGLVIGFGLGSLFGIGAMVVGSHGRKTAMAFGPFLAAGTVVAILASDPILDAWG